MLKLFRVFSSLMIILFIVSSSIIVAGLWVSGNQAIGGFSLILLPLLIMTLLDEHNHDNLPLWKYLFLIDEKPEPYCVIRKRRFPNASIYDCDNCKIKTH